MESNRSNWRDDMSSSESISANGAMEPKKEPLHFLRGSVFLESLLAPEEVARRIGGRLFPNGESVKWEVLDRDEIFALGVMGFGGFNLELHDQDEQDSQDGRLYVLYYNTDHHIFDFMHKRKIAIEQIWVDIDYQLWWAVEGIPEVKVRTSEEVKAKREARLTDEDRFWKSEEGQMEMWRRRFLGNAKLDNWERHPMYERWEKLGFEGRYALILLYTEQMKNPSLQDLEEFLASQTGFLIEEIPALDYF